MNKINRLHIMIAAFAAALLMIYKSAQTENRIAEAAAENSKTEQLGKQIMQMKASWGDPKQMQKRVDQILANNAFQSYVSKTETTQNVYRIRLQNLPAGMLDKLTTKLLNEPVAVKQLQMNRGSDQNVTVTVEFFL